MPFSSLAQQDKLAGCLLGAALGDALGAPVEASLKLQTILDRVGPQGVTGLLPYSGYPDEHITYTGTGVITDDTTSLASTFAAMLLATPNSLRLPEVTWQAYLNWGYKQDEGAPLRSFIDPELGWPDEIKPFWHCCGAGRGTMAALLTGQRGTRQSPVRYNTVIRGKPVQSPNAGCGGMMRVAALAFWPGEDDVFSLACDNAALTHGDPSAVLASGVIAAYAKALLHSQPLSQVFEQVCQRLQREPDYASTHDALAAGWAHGLRHQRGSFEEIDALPKQLGVKSAFMARAVLAQVMYALAAHEGAGLSVHESLALAVTHGGDSDSVGSIVGSLLGLYKGSSAFPENLTHKLQLKRELTELAQKAGGILLPQSINRDCQSQTPAP